MNITIRHTEPDDYEALHAIMTQPRAAAGTMQMPLASKESWRKRLADPRDGFYSLVACVEVAGEPRIVGSASLDIVQRPRRRHVAGLGMAVHDDWQGRGVGSALMAALVDLADNWIDVQRIELTVYTDNAAAVHLYKKFGFEVEGTLRSYAFRNGVYVDAYYMARLRA